MTTTMSTISLSLSEKQLTIIDEMIARYGFNNRSEFFRALLRLVAQKPDIAKTAAVFPFIKPSSKSVTTIINDFKKTNKYPDAFLADLEKGLKSSNYFVKV